MVAEDVLNIIQELRQLCKQSVDSGEFDEKSYEVIIKSCNELQTSDQYDVWAPALVQLIEEYDDKIDLTEGYPGYFGRALESGELKTLSNLYVESLKRHPTGLITGLADRMYRTHGNDCGFGLDTFQSVLEHPHADEGAKEIADMALEI